MSFGREAQICRSIDGYLLSLLSGYINFWGFISGLIGAVVNGGGIGISLIGRVICRGC